MNIVKILIASVFIWSLIGSIYYIVMCDKVKRQPQLFVLGLIAGPFFWLALPIVKLFDLGSGSFYSRFHNWMTKE